MSRIVDLYGIDVIANRSIDWRSVLADQRCPYVDKKCFKVRKSQPDISIGTCAIQHGPNSSPIVICPQRLLERQQIFIDCLHLLHDHAPGNELHTVSEISVPGGRVDYFLVSVLEGRTKDFVGIEIQTLDTTGTVWPERQRLLQDLGLEADQRDVSSDKSYGMNWKMTAKTILLQLHHKATTFEHLNKHLVLVLQDELFEYMKREFSFGHLTAARDVDPMHFHSYGFQRRADGHRIALAERQSTDAEGIAISLGLQAEPRVDLDAIMATIEAKISAATLFKLA